MHAGIVVFLVIFAFEITAATWGYSHKDEVSKELQEFYTNTYFKLKPKDKSQQEMLKATHYTLNGWESETIHPGHLPPKGYTQASQ